MRMLCIMASHLWPAWLLVPVVLCGSIATWNADTDLARQIMMSYESKIYYSLCNSSEAPVFPFDETNILELPFPIMGGTKITGTGYKTDNGSEAAVFYQESSGQIIQAIYECNSKGYFDLLPHRSRKVSLGVADSILEATGMKIFPIEPGEGFRLFYKDKNHRIAIMSCGPGAEDWFPSEYASQLEWPGSAIGGGFISSGAPIVVSPFSSLNETSGIQVCIENAKASEWQIDAFPGQMQVSDPTAPEGSLKGPTNASLPNDDWTWNDSGDDLELDSFDANSVDLAISFGSTGGSNIFYIGKDRWLHQYRLTRDGTWTKVQSQNETIWPNADSPYGSVGVDFDARGDMIWLYYMFDGSLIQVQQTGDGTWEKPARLPTRAPIPPAPSSTTIRRTSVVAGATGTATLTSIVVTTDGPASPSAATATANSTAPAPTSAGSTGLSLGQRFGIGLGACAGLIVFALCAVNLYNYVRDSRDDRDARWPTSERNYPTDKTEETNTSSSMFERRHLGNIHTWGRPSRNPEAA